MSEPATICFTPAQIARALRRQRPAVARALADIPADGVSVINGAPAQAWSLAALPASLRADLAKAAHCRGVAGAQVLLRDPAQPWQPSVPLAEIAQSTLEEAARLHRALGRMLARQNDTTLSAADLEAIGQEDYRREFGHVVSVRHLRRLVNRTLDRDAGALKFDRLEIYLPQKPARKTADMPAPILAGEADFESLREVMLAFQNPAAPSAAEKTYLWLRAFELYDQVVSEGRAPKKFKRRLLKFLERHALFLISPDCVSALNSLRVNFQNKYSRWLDSGRNAKALADARAESSGRFRAPELSQEDRDKLIAHAVFACGGRVAQAWRELMERNELSEAIMGYYLSNPASKSYVPRVIMDAVKQEVASMADIHHGPRQAQLNGPHISREWSAVHSLDWLQADDFTFPVYYRAPDGNGGWQYMRGQVLLMIDLRSTRILGFLLLSERNYNARAIRTLITKVCDQYGLPRRGFYFENGIWKKSKFITGAKDAPAMSWGETETGLREFGLEFKHAKLPRGKLVERVGGLMQDMMEGLPGYVGRNEMVEKFERVQKLLREAQRGDRAAIAQFMDEDQWSAQLEILCERYNAAAQNGKVSEDRSPDETFNECQNLSDPPVKFSPACRYLLAHHKRPVKVLNKGILIDKVYYYGAEIAHLKGHTLLAWIDPESPDFITVTDMNRQNAACVPRAKDVPAMDATPEMLEAAYGQIAAFQAHTKARYRILKARQPIAFRPMIASRETVELGAEIGEQRAAVELEQRTQSANESRSRKAASRLGMAVPQNHMRRPETAASLERLAKLMNDDAPADEASEKGNP